MARHLVGSIVLLLLGSVVADADVSEDNELANALDSAFADAAVGFAESTAEDLEMAEALQALQDASQSASADAPPKSISPEMLAALAKLGGKRGPGNPSSGPGFKIPKPLHSNAPHSEGPRNPVYDAKVTADILKRLMAAVGTQNSRIVGVDGVAPNLAGNRGAGGKPAGGDASAFIKALTAGKGAAGGTPGMPAGGAKNDFLKKLPKSSAASGPQQQEQAKKAAAKAMGGVSVNAVKTLMAGSATAAASVLGDGQSKLNEKLAQLLKEPADPVAVAQLMAEVNREPTEQTVHQLTQLKAFLETTVASEPAFDAMRSLLSTPDGLFRLARFSDASKKALGGFHSNGAAWGTTFEGFAAAARMVQASMALDGKQHEAFSAESALALMKYLQTHPDEAKASFKGMLSR